MLINGKKIGVTSNQQCSSKSCFNFVKKHPMNIGIYKAKELCIDCLIRSAKKITEDTKIKVFV